MNYVEQSDPREFALGDLPLPRPGDVKSSYQVVWTALRRAIISGALPGGAHLVQAELADRMGVSVTPVREALRGLACEGLVELDRYRGAIVHKTTAEELREIYEMRIALEPLAIERTIGRLDATDLATGRELVAQMGHTGDIATFVDLNRQFHATLTAASGAPRLIDVLGTLRDASALYVGASFQNSIDLMRTSNVEHGRLLDAISAGETETAKALIAQHLGTTLDTLTSDQH